MAWEYTSIMCLQNQGFQEEEQWVAQKLEDCTEDFGSRCWSGDVGFFPQDYAGL